MGDFGRAVFDGVSVLFLAGWRSDIKKKIMKKEEVTVKCCFFFDFLFPPPRSTFLAKVLLSPTNASNVQVITCTIVSM